MKQMKHSFLAGLLFTAMASMTLTTATAQSEDYNRFMENQFYGNRVKLGSVLLNGAFQRTSSNQDDLDGVTGTLGIGIGVGLNENVVFAIGYQRERERLLLQDINNQFIFGLSTVNTFQAGFRFLPNTIGGFVQPYLGADFVALRFDERGQPGDEPLFEQRNAGANFPVGVIFWISTFMSVNLELVNFSMLGGLGEDVSFNPIFNAELRLLNPTFGLSFLLNGKKPVR